MSTSHGAGRTLPADSATQNGFLQESTTEAEGNGWVTSAQVLLALSEITAAQAAAAGQFNVLPSTITTGTTAARPGGVYFASAAAAATLNLPSAAAASTVGVNTLRQVTLSNISGSITAYAAATVDLVNGASNVSVAPGAAKKFDTDGTHWYTV